MNVRYKNYETVKGVFQPNTGGTPTQMLGTTLASKNNFERRNAKVRQFYQAMIHSDKTGVNTYNVQLSLISGSTEYRLESLDVAPGDSHVFNEQDYGVDLAPDEYVRFAWLSASTHSSDKLTFFLRTRDIV